MQSWQLPLYILFLCSVIVLHLLSALEILLPKQILSLKKWLDLYFDLSVKDLKSVYVLPWLYMCTLIYS